MFFCGVLLAGLRYCYALPSPRCAEGETIGSHLVSSTLEFAMASELRDLRIDFDNKEAICRLPRQQTYLERRHQLAMSVFAETKEVLTQEI